MEAQCYMPQRACDNPSVSDQSIRHIHVTNICGLFETSLLSSHSDIAPQFEDKEILECPTAAGSVVLFGGRKLKCIPLVIKM